MPPREALENLFEALEDSLKKIISKMGITTIEGYRGAMLFEAVGFGPELMEYLGDFPSRVGGLTLNDLVDDAKWRVELAEKMNVLGRNRDYMAFNAKVRMALRDAVKEAHPETDATGGGGGNGLQPPARRARPGCAHPRRREVRQVQQDMVKTRPPTVLRDLFNIKKSFAPPVPVAEVQARRRDGEGAVPRRRHEPRRSHRGQPHDHRGGDERTRRSQQQRRRRRVPLAERPARTPPR